MTTRALARTPTPSHPASRVPPRLARLHAVRAAREPARLDLEAAGRELADADAERVVAWAANTFGDGLVVSTSFGIQAAVMLHMATQVVPRIPVVWVDTGYLPAETYRFADALASRLDLNLHVAQAEVSPARMEALLGRLWEGSRDDLDRYHRLRKVEPLERAFRALGARAWLSGLRADQTGHRARLPRVGLQNGRAKLLPLLPWSSRDVHRYLKAHDLPYHPFFEQGYASVGDWHSSRPVGEGDANERSGRFRGLAEECGLHLELSPEERRSLEVTTTIT
jgi:phosphoadenosine phosphosulfate reductase